MANQSRRGFLAYLGIASAATAATTAAVVTAAPAAAIPESAGYFTNPADYLAAMLAIGWRPLAMFQRRENGGIHCMGVNETAPDEETVRRTWKQYHAISMRVPVERHVIDGGWWNQVWLHLYDLGYREDDVTSCQNQSRLGRTYT